MTILDAGIILYAAVLFKLDLDMLLFNRCWSYVGDFQSGQIVSIGERCEYKDTVEHEILHALGFYHEQSRTDRDDYVNIWWEEIIPGKRLIVHCFLRMLYIFTYCKVQ